MLDHASDGYITWNGFRTYYRIFGEPHLDKAPLVVLQGGPGSAHNYMLGLAAISSERQVVFYDQLGTGLSDHPKDRLLWSVETYLRELRAVRDQLNLSAIHLLGHSWGGMLAIEYLLTKPGGIQSATLASSMISMPFFINEVEKLKRDLPKETYNTLTDCERNDTTDTEAYRKAYREYFRRHIYRGGEFPKKYDDPEGTYGADIYEKLWGKSEAYPDGELKDWDRIDDLASIELPCLITAGQYDELTPAQAVVTHNKIQGSELRIFTAGSHCAHVEFEDEYNRVVSEFISKNDS